MQKVARWICFILIFLFAFLHTLHLRADFPNHTQWYHDWAKYTDEGWYGNAAIRAHLFGNWYMPGDFNPAPGVPLWPFLEWILFFVTGVSIQAARGLSVAFFLLNLGLSYLLVRTRAPRWAALLALILMVTSPFLYCFSRLAILEPLLTTITLAAFNLAVRLPKFRRPLFASIAIGLLFSLALLTKTTAVFLLPAFAWALIVPLWEKRDRLVRCALAAMVTAAVCFGGWMLLVARLGLLGDFKYLLFVNKYEKPPHFYWPLLSFWWSFHGGLWVDHILIPLAGLIAFGAGVLWLAGRSKSARALVLDPVFGASVWAVVGYLLFMTYQNHPQPRYFAVVAIFCFIPLALGVAALMGSDRPLWARRTGLLFIGVAGLAVLGNAAQTLSYALHPEYTFVNAAERLTRYIDQHPNGNRLLLSISGDQITLLTHLPGICDDFGTEELVDKLEHYQPGWWATWNDIDPGTLEDLHNHYSLEQVASFRALDDPERNLLVLFKLHPLPDGEFRDMPLPATRVPLPGDKIEIPVQ